MVFCNVVLKCATQNVTFDQGRAEAADAARSSTKFFAQLQEEAQDRIKEAQGTAQGGKKKKGKSGPSRDFGFKL